MPGKMLHCGPKGEGITACSRQPPKNCQVRFLVKCSAVDTPLANLAMGNIFFILQGLSCSKSPPNGLPAKSSPKNAFLNRSVLLKLIGKKANENQLLGAW